MRNTYFGTSAALRTGAYYIGPVQPRNWSATPMLMGLATLLIADPRPKIPKSPKILKSVKLSLKGSVERQAQHRPDRLKKPRT